MAQSAGVIEHTFNHSTSSHPDSHCAQRRRENVILRGPFGQKDLDKAGMKMVEVSRAWHDWAEFQAPPLQLADNPIDCIEPINHVSRTFRFLSL